MFDSCLKKQNALVKLFTQCKNQEEKYEKIIEFGKQLESLPQSEWKDHLVVQGCQSKVYLLCEMKEGLIHFKVGSDALISTGLAALLVMVYSDETPEVILKCPPTFLHEIGITSSLTQNRANGLFSIHLRMKQEALKLLIEQAKQG